MSENETVLAIVGAGPKGIAIAAKRSVLDEAGFSVPRLLVFEPNAVAAHWAGGWGYTDGTMPLGTSPEKDVGYPYDSACWNEESPRINRLLLRFSWQAFFVAAQESGAITFGTYSGWIDRGRPPPAHSDWAKYLNWVGGQVLGDSLVPERVNSLGAADSRWEIVTSDPEGHGTTTYVADGIVITGPGPPQHRIENWVENRLLLDGTTYWEWARNPPSFEGPWQVCVAGTGETAAAAVASLLRLLPAYSTIDIVCPQGVVYSRGESYDENRFFSDPRGWPRLEEHHRREFVSRTDRGVFSRHTKTVIDSASRITTLPGHLKKIVDLSDTRVEAEIKYVGNVVNKHYELVIDATGFDQFWFEDLLSDVAHAEYASAVQRFSGKMAARNRFAHTDEERKEIALCVQRGIEHDLALRGLEPKLHLPMLAGISQGPGFPNLSSLGLMSDRILSNYTQEPQ